MPDVDYIVPRRRVGLHGGASVIDGGKAAEVLGGRRNAGVERGSRRSGRFDRFAGPAVWNV